MSENDEDNTSETESRVNRLKSMPSPQRYKEADVLFFDDGASLRLMLKPLPLDFGGIWQIIYRRSGNYCEFICEKSFVHGGAILQL